MKIFVNGQQKEVSPVRISYDEVVNLARPNTKNAYTLFTVTWHTKDRHGSMMPGDMVTLEEGMRFDVTHTGGA